jgi:hypothetical protein
MAADLRLANGQQLCFVIGGQCWLNDHLLQSQTDASTISLQHLRTQTKAFSPFLWPLAPSSR